MSWRRETTECRIQSFGSHSQNHCTLIKVCPARCQSFCAPQMTKCLPIPLPFEWAESPISMPHCVLCAGHLSGHFRSHSLRATTQKGPWPKRLCAPSPNIDDEVLDFQPNSFINWNPLTVSIICMCKWCELCGQKVDSVPTVFSKDGHTTISHPTYSFVRSLYIKRWSLVSPPLRIFMGPVTTLNRKVQNWQCATYQE